MKVNSFNTSINQSQLNKSANSDIQFKGKLTNCLTGKFEGLGEKLKEFYAKNKEFSDFPYDTFVYKEEDTLKMDTHILKNGTEKEIITVKKLSDITYKTLSPLIDMLYENQRTAKIRMAGM